MRHARRSRLLSLTAALAVALTLSVAPVAAGAIITCHVSNRTEVPHSYYTSLQTAVNDATAGDVLRVRGQCYEHTEVDRDLTIRGQKTVMYGKPTLSGYDTVQVLHVAEGVTLTIKRLTIRDGFADGGYPGNSGGGIGNDGTLTLRRVVVRGGHAYNGGGISNRGTMSLYGHTKIMHNHADSNNGGGVDNDSTSRAATMTMNGTSVIKRNSAWRGGGVNMWESSLTMNDASSIHHNTAGNTGGGVAKSCGVDVADTIGVVDGGNVHDNDPTDVEVDGVCI